MLKKLESTSNSINKNENFNSITTKNIVILCLILNIKKLFEYKIINIFD